MFLKRPALEKINKMNEGSMLGHIGIEFTEIGEDYLKGSMPVDHRTIQPFGLLHGGASVALAESLGSMASYLTIDPERFICVGQEINANHIRSARNGSVMGIARPVHIGKNSQVWEIRISDEDDRLVCISRMTMAVIPKKI